MAGYEAPVDIVSDDSRARRNTFILSAAQALYNIGSMIIITLGGIVGHQLADDKSLATLPVSTYVLGTALSTVPASFIMHAIGRRAGFMIGAVFSISSGLIAAYAIMSGSFWLFCLATLFAGAYQACAQYYRFAAADTASPVFRPKAISWVLAGGLVAAFAAPQIIIYTKDMFAPILFAGSFLASAVTALVALAILSFVDIPRPRKESPAGGAPRPLSVILRQPGLLVAILCGMVAYGTMNFVMTATPLAMVGCNHPVDAAAHTIQWHVVAMFVPSFFTGHLVTRLGRGVIVLTGLALLAACGAIALSGLAVWQFTMALVLLGVGWNFAFVGATTMVTDYHRPEERGKVQAVNEMCVFGCVALASFASGKILHVFGWSGVSLAIFPAILLTAFLVLVTLFRTSEGRPAT